MCLCCIETLSMLMNKYGSMRKDYEGTPIKRTIDKENPVETCLAYVTDSGIGPTSSVD